MKQVKFLGMMAMMLCALMMGFSSCSDDDDEVPGGGNENTLTGGNSSSSDSDGEVTGGVAWQGVTIDYIYKEDGEIVEQGSGEDFSGYCVKFYTDGTLADAEWWDGEWHWENYVKRPKWKINGSKITLSYYDEYEGWFDEVTGTILELSDTKMVIESHLIYTDDGVNYDEYDKVVFKKINL